MSLLLRFKVSGHSMMPTLKPNQEILVSLLPYLFSSPKIKDLVAFKSGSRNIIKRINSINKKKYLVKGDNENDSKDYGWISKKDIIGKVIYVYA